MKLAELHVHLEGTVRHETALELAALNGLPSPPPYHYSDFAGFLNAFKEVTARLRAPEDFELITDRLLARLHAENVRHAEIIFSAGVCLWRKQDVAATHRSSTASWARSTSSASGGIIAPSRA